MLTADQRIGEVLTQSGGAQEVKKPSLHVDEGDLEVHRLGEGGKAVREFERGGPVYPVTEVDLDLVRSQSSNAGDLATLA